MIHKIRATYRWQFNHQFTFKQALELVPYLDRLGVSHVYASPFFRASPGSMHGYDVCDHNELNPEVGTRQELETLVSELHQRNMGLILDFVPNHMGISDPNNQWWSDLLENGPASPFARFFDVEWHPLKPALENKVLLPILDDQYGRVLERGSFKLAYADGRYTLEVSGTILPLAPRTLRPLLRRTVELHPSPPDELLSIITALDNLPDRAQTDEGMIAERAREIGIIRKRLASLAEVESATTEAIQRALEEWQQNDADSLNRLDTLLSDQPYRLCYWRVAAEEINYRRFFDVNSLAAIRVELPEVFDATHALLLELLRDGLLDGVRIDHIDGLAFPGEYLRQLRARMDEATGDRGRALLLVEKILGSHENLRREWPVDGTTGYEFGSQVMNLLVNQSQEKALNQCYTRFTGSHMDYRERVYESKRLITQLTMASEVNVLGTLLSRLSEGHRWYRDFTVNALTAAIREVIACFPVYRTYIDPEQPATEEDVQVINLAIAQARRRNPALERSVFDFIRIVLLPSETDAHPLDEATRRAFVLRFQQCTGPITAKGVEDTAFYVYNRLVALNEVGGHPGTFGASVDAFHRCNQQRLADWPNCMLATSTHDTKRSEDVRARIVALSETPREWAQAVRRWSIMNGRKKRLVDGVPAPDANEEYLIYQTIIGCWPLHSMSDEEHAVYIQRLQDYMTKALHEAKVNSSWIDPNEAWDQSVRDFIERILAREEKNKFPAAFAPLAHRIAQVGAVNSLAQTVLKLTAPGIPDIYQGTEMWDFSLVDPDNRRPVDYAQRQQNLDELHSVEEMMSGWKDGRIKLFVIQKLLALRREHPDLFAGGSYEPLTLQGARSGNCIAFQRRWDRQTLVIIIPRTPLDLGFPPTGACWKETAVELTDQRSYQDLFTGRIHDPAGNLSIAEVLDRVPVAVLVARE